MHDDAETKAPSTPDERARSETMLDTVEFAGNDDASEEEEVVISRQDEHGNEESTNLPNSTQVELSCDRTIEHENHENEHGLNAEQRPSLTESKSKHVQKLQRDHSDPDDRKPKHGNIDQFTPSLQSESMAEQKQRVLNLAKSIFLC